MNYRVVFTRQAQKDAKKLSGSNLKEKAVTLVGILKEDPFRNPPPFEQLVGNLTGTFSRRINIQHKLVYQVTEKEKVVKVIRMWTHYK